MSIVVVAVVAVVAAVVAGVGVHGLGYMGWGGNMSKGHEKQFESMMTMVFVCQCTEITAAALAS